MKKLTRAIAIGCPIVFALFVLAWLLRAGPSIQVSPATTFITQPLTEDGLPDYEAFLLQEGFNQMGLEDNAAVLLWQACWPGELSGDEAKPVLDALGIESISAPESTLKPILSGDSKEMVSQWLQDQNLKLQDTPVDLESDTVEALIHSAMSRPWNREELPPLAAWVDQNERALDLVVAASKRPKFFSPSPSWLNNEYDMMISTLLPLTASVRSASRGLCVRAMIHLGEGRTAEAIEDATACLRLASLTCQGFCLVQEMVAVASYEIGFRALATILHEGAFSPKKLQSLQSEIKGMPAIRESIRILDRGERFSYLDSLIAVNSGYTVSGIDLLLLRRADWNVALAEGNRMYDRLVAIAAKPTREQRTFETAKLDQELDRAAARAKNRKGDARILVDRKLCGEVMSDISLSLMLPAIGTIFDAEDRQETCRQMALTAVDLALYRAKNGDYPETLSQLTSKVPIDLYSDNPLVYDRKDDNGYLLYSVFENAEDDGGCDVGGEICNGEWADCKVAKENSDLVIRLPAAPIDLEPHSLKD